jgi:hypothetical protein
MIDPDQMDVDDHTAFDDEAIVAEPAIGDHLDAEEFFGDASSPEDLGGEANTADDAFAVMSGVDQVGAEALRERWGADADANLAYARSAVSALATSELIEALEESGLGDHPAVIEVAARIGRQLAGEAAGDWVGSDHVLTESASLNDRHRRLTEQLHAAMDRGDRRAAETLDRARTQVAEALSGEHISDGYRDWSVGPSSNDLEARHAELTARLHDAMDSGDRAEAERLDRERSRIAQRIVGGGPIVGSEGRVY